MSLRAISTILTASVLSITLTGFGSVDIAQGQVNSTSLTPEQKAAIYDPNDVCINTAKSKICSKN